MKKYYALARKIFLIYIADSFYVINSYLGIKTELIMSSTLKKDCSLKGQDKIIAICEELGATEYYNAIGGQGLYTFEEFSNHNIELKFVKPAECYYEQFGETVRKLG